MSNNTRKIVVLNNLDSPRIEQAIFILRDEVKVSEIDALSEAQRIVDCYVKSLEASPLQEEKKVKPKSKFRSFMVMMLYTFATAILTAYLLAFLK